MLVIHLYKDGIMFVGDVDDHTIIERMANKTTEFQNNNIVKKQFLSIKRKIGLEMDGFKCIYNEQKSGDYFTWKRNFYTIERDLGIQNEILEEKV